MEDLERIERKLDTIEIDLCRITEMYETREQYWFFSDGDYDTAKQRFVREKRRKLNDIKFLLENMQKCGKFLEIWTEGQAMMNFTK